MIFGVIVGTFCSIFLAAPIAYAVMTRKKNDGKAAAAKAAASQRLTR